MSRKIRWIVIFVSIFTIISLSRSVVDLWERRTIVEQEQRRLREFEKKHEDLTQKLQIVQTPEFVEREARERLGMAKEGETIILLDGSSLPDDTGKEIQVDNAPTLPYWKRWWQVFF